MVDLIAAVRTAARAADVPRMALLARQIAGVLGPHTGQIVGASMLSTDGAAESMTGIAAHHLLSHPGALERVRADPALLAGAIQESLRLEPAATRVDRYATTDTELADARIQAGELVIVCLSAANRDPEVFTDPDRYDIGRGNATDHLAFAVGPHYCLGAYLATLQTTLALRMLLERFPGIHPAGQLPPITGFIFRKPASVPVWLA